MRAAVAMLLCAAVPAAGAAHTFEATDGGLPPKVWAYSARLVTQADGGFVDSAGPGGWLPEPRLEAEARELVDLRTQNATLMATPPLFSAPTWVALGLCAAIFLAGGLFLGWEVHGLLAGH